MHCQTTSFNEATSLPDRTVQEEATKVTPLYSEIHVSLYATRYVYVLSSHTFLKLASATLLFIFGNNRYGFYPYMSPLSPHPLPVYRIL